MRLSFVLPEINRSGGVNCVLQYARLLQERGHQPWLVTSRINSAEMRQLTSGLEVIETPEQLTRGLLPAQARLVASLAHSIPQCDRIIATHTPSVVPVLAAAARRRGRPTWLCMDYPEMFAGRPLERALLELAPAAFPTVMTLSRDTARFVRRRRLGRDMASTRVVGLGIAAAYLEAPCLTARVPGVVLYVGDARPRKGLREFLAAMALVVAARPGARARLVTRDAAVEQLVVEGWPFPIELVKADDEQALLAEYDCCQVFVSSSWAEGFGLPPLEAMARGAAVVATDSRGVRDYARHGRNCLLAPPRSVPALATAIDQLLTDQCMQQRLGAAGRLTAAGFTWERAVRRMERALGDSPTTP